MSDEDKKEIIEEASKRFVWGILDGHTELNNLGNYARWIARKQNNYTFLRVSPSKDLRVRYGIGYKPLGASTVWWLLEQWEKGNITIKEDAQPKP